MQPSCCHLPILLARSLGERLYYVSEVVSFHIFEAHPKSQFMGVLLVQTPTHCQQAQSLQSYNNGLCKSISTQHTTKIFWMKINKKLAWQAPYNDYDSTFWLNMLRPAKIIAFSKSYFWLVRYVDWSRWFAIRWLWCFIVPVYVFWGEARDL